MKVALVIGHHSKSKGAFSDDFNMFEYDFYTEVVKHITGIAIFTHSPYIGSYTQRIKYTAKFLDEGNFDLVMELHFNSAIPQANGCETLYYFRSKKGKFYAEVFSSMVAFNTNIRLRNRGLKALINRNDRGFASVYYPKAPTILIEPFFGSNEKDCKEIGSVENMACIIQEFIDSL